MKTIPFYFDSVARADIEDSAIARPKIDVKKVRAHIDKIMEEAEEFSLDSWDLLSPIKIPANSKYTFDWTKILDFSLRGPTQSILAHLTRASIGAHRSLSLTACERKAWPRNRCINP